MDRYIHLEISSKIYKVSDEHVNLYLSYQKTFWRHLNTFKEIEMA